MTETNGASPKAITRDIKRKNRRKFTAGEKIRIVVDGLRGERSINDLCRKEEEKQDLAKRAGLRKRAREPGNA